VKPEKRVSIIGSRISVCGPTCALAALEERLAARRGGYVCFTNAHAAVLCRRDAQFRGVTNGSFLSLADGKSVYWLGRLKGATDLGHVPGPDFLISVLERFPQRRHFFYGSAPSVLESLVRSLRKQIPDLNICGSLSPPFRPLTQNEVREGHEQIRQANPDFIWVGLGAPKQELWMAESWQSLQPAILLGVGAAFDFHAGRVRRAPAALRLIGFEWLYRLLQEPQRLWKRYLITNTLFLYYSFQDALCGNDRR
jgi:N-acetylglucosaminyldiphosphoundecaprenol N-acetyl-beta-D-mannosaminyltransferase